jgi:Flp pilus assembly protein TadG
MGLSSAVLFAMFFGLFELTMAGYTFHFVSEAARDATRWAIVRGSTSCTNTPGLDHCGSASSSTDIQAHVSGIGMSGDSHLTATPYYYSPSAGTPTTWTSCNPATTTCTQPGYLLKIVVTDNFALNVPFLPTYTIPISSTSQMVIAQ